MFTFIVSINTSSIFNMQMKVTFYYDILKNLLNSCSQLRLLCAYQFYYPYSFYPALMTEHSKS